ncbi:MAG: DNA-directed RNA polymerase subunit beta [bacterium]|nr:DNA-directed RNA polymerase subunit beta [bacterium]
MITTPRTQAELPDLVEIQKGSYDWFLDQGIRELFDEISPINDFIGRDLELHFGKYYFDEAKFDEQTSREKNLNFEAPLRVETRLVNKRTGEVREQEVYLGDFPMMTPRGTFVINGVERVVISQIIRSSGVLFKSEFNRGRRWYGAQIIPNRGAWLEVETDAHGVLWVKIDRKRKVAATTLMRAFGWSTEEEIRGLLQDVDTDPNHSYVDATLKRDTAADMDEGLVEVYKRIRPGDLATPENAKQLLHGMFFRFDRYDFGRVGRYKLNLRFGEQLPITRETRMLRPEDFVQVLREVIRLNRTQEEADDVDHLGNRRIRPIGELVQGKLRIGLARMERIVKDRMSTMEIQALTPAKLINARPVIGAIREFFMSSQLSQFMDQTNPLAELEHKRRISAMGPGGLSRERAGFDVRDVHRTHYGRICPIATPEGPNIGLVGHLASFARVNEYGFIETPYRKVIKNGSDLRVADAAEYLPAIVEEQFTTCAATAVGPDGRFIGERVPARRHGKPVIAPVTEIDYVDVAPHQIVSVSTSLIPFLEHDDANRALMGTNMQRQAVPLITPQAPIVGTGVEMRAAADSGYVALAQFDGTVTEVDGGHVVVEGDAGKRQEVTLTKFLRSNAATCINQRPIVALGQQVHAGQPIADGPSTDHGELALGQNVLVAYMIWGGYNYEDAIIISDRVVQRDRFTSIHIEHHTVDVRETKLGPEVITNDIPNVSEEKLANLDGEGVVRVGAEVSSGDILVGKITPKGETELSAEEKLLRAIFGEKARDVRDTSKTLEHGERGKVVDVKEFSVEAGDKLSPGVIRSVRVSVADLRKVQAGDKLAGRHGNKGVISKIVPAEDMPFLPDGTPVDVILTPLGVVSRMNLGQVLETHLGLAAHALGYTVATPPLDGIPSEIIADELEKAGYPRSGQVTLFDGKTGEAFSHPVTIGYKYILKLAHMVDDKIHQRSIGPYSLITQQPLGGKAQFGGQRFGEMEVWALEAYGAAHMLQEILTIKSDDVPGRAKAYEAIIKGEPIEKRNVPESFHVLVRELKGLCLDVELLKEKKGAGIPKNGERKNEEPVSVE